MLFVTVGTHEQPFNRLLEKVDMLKKSGQIKEDVIIQTGYSTYKPRYCAWEKLYPYAKMLQLVEKARIVVTHGGPSSFIMPLQMGKIPIVVPRQKQYNEHVNDHQVEFCQEVAERYHSIILVEDIERLGYILNRYEELSSKMEFQVTSNNSKFCKEFETIVSSLLKQ